MSWTLVESVDDGCTYLISTQGFGGLPAIAEDCVNSSSGGTLGRVGNCECYVKKVSFRAITDRRPRFLFFRGIELSEDRNAEGGVT